MLIKSVQGGDAIVTVAGNEAEGIRRLARKLDQPYEYSAYIYEGIARIVGKFELGKPWCELTQDEKRMLAKRWPHPPRESRPIYKFEINGNLQEPGYAYFKGIFWNLQINDKTLLREFTRLINQERRRQGVVVLSPNKGRSNKPLSWRPIELLDIYNNKVRTLNESERSQISKAQKLFETELKKCRPSGTA